MSRRYNHEDPIPVRKPIVEDSRQPGAAGPRTEPSRDLYVPLELRPFTGRPGAMDAFALPSRGSFD